YAHWLRAAGHATCRRQEAADLLHDSLMDAMRARRTDFTSLDTRRWFTGVLKNRARMDARSAVRRVTRQKLCRGRGLEPATTTSPDVPQAFIASLPRSARAVAVLALSGMNRQEIAAALNIAPTAFRQRLTCIRRAWQKSGSQV